MPNVKANGIRIEYDTIGNPSFPPLLLIMGLGGQLIHWDDDFCRQLAAIQEVDKHRASQLTHCSGAAHHTVAGHQHHLGLGAGLQQVHYLRQKHTRALAIGHGIVYEMADKDVVNICFKLQQ